MFIYNKIGIVLAGGGAKGAYQLGVWHALKQLGIDQKISVISGTSIGALNGIMMAMNDIEGCYGFWSKAAITPSDNRFKKRIEKVIGKKNSVAFDNLTQHPFLSSAKLNKLLDEVIDVSKIKKRLYVTCHDVKKNKSVYFLIDTLSKEQIKKVLMGSTCLPGIFKKQDFNGSSYRDGGISDNVPLKPLLYEKCTTMIVVYLKNQPPQINKPNVIEIIPSINLGAFRDGTLNFYQDKLKMLIESGYYDAYRILRNKMHLFSQTFLNSGS